MGAAPRRQVKRFELLTDFLEWLLQSDAPTVTLIICSTKREFLQKLSVSVQESQQSRSDHQEAETETIPQPTSLHSLAHGVIETIARSQRVTAAFCPSVEHLRAHLSVLRISEDNDASPGSRRYPGKRMIAIVDPLEAHSRSSELSAQGLSRSLALAVEVAARERADIFLCETGHGGYEGTANGSPWDMEIPLLSMAVGVERTVGSGATAQPERIARRWFRFDKKHMDAQ